MSAFSVSTLSLSSRWEEMALSRAWCSWRPSEMFFKQVSWLENKEKQGSRHDARRCRLRCDATGRLSWRKPRLPTSVTLFDMSTGAEGMPMVDAMFTSLAFSGEFSSVRPCGTEPEEWWKVKKKTCLHSSKMSRSLISARCMSNHHHIDNDLHLSRWYDDHLFQNKVHFIICLPTRKQRVDVTYLRHRAWKSAKWALLVQRVWRVSC